MDGKRRDAEARRSQRERRGETRAHIVARASCLRVTGASCSESQIRHLLSLAHIEFLRGGCSRLISFSDRAGCSVHPQAGMPALRCSSGYPCK